jgi:segregation and condensation protein A
MTHAANDPHAGAAAAEPFLDLALPVAKIRGEPVTELPSDLYIPPEALSVFLEAFEGPLDLLLYLIRKQNLDILDIPLAEITRQYMQYIDVMQDLQLELAGEYMVMAATLAEIKSRMLLPRPKVDAEGNEVDPRAELVRRLQEYERFKRAAEDLDSLPRLERDVWMTSAELKDRPVVRALPQITLQEMLLAFKDVVVRSEMFAHHHIQRERLSVRARMGDILSTLEQSSFLEFVRLFRPEEGRMGVTVTFIAILELVREGLIDIVQAEPYAPIHVRAAGPNRKLRVVADNAANDSVLEEETSPAAQGDEAEPRTAAGAEVRSTGGAKGRSAALAAGDATAAANAAGPDEAAPYGAAAAGATDDDAAVGHADDAATDATGPAGDAASAADGHFDVDDDDEDDTAFEAEDELDLALDALRQAQQGPRLDRARPAPEQPESGQLDTEQLASRQLLAEQPAATPPTSATNSNTDSTPDIDQTGDPKLEPDA